MKISKLQFILISLLLLFLPFLLFWQVWWPDPTHQLVFEDGDFVTQHYPMRAWVAQEYRAGRLPLWSPYTFSGEPAAAESLYTVFYPLGLVELLFPSLPFWVLEVEVLFYLGLAGFFTFLFIRQLTGRWDAALLAGATFGLSGFLTSYPSLQMIILQVALWLPAGLWLLERALQRRSLWGLGWAGAAFGIGLLGGHFQTFLYVIYLTGAYFVFRVVNLRLSWRFIGGALLVLGAFVICVGAPQWLPSAEMAGRSPRAGLPYAVVAHGFQTEELWGILRPNLGEWSPLYVGLIPLGLAALALATAHRPASWFWGSVAIIALLLSLGGNGFLYPLFHALAPGFRLFRDQERAALLVTFALVVLAGYGYARLAEYPRWPRWGWLPLLLLLCGNLYYANHRVILQAPPPGGYTAPTAALCYLQEHYEMPERISSEAQLPLGGNVGAYFQLRDVTGNGPLYQEKYELLLDLVPEVRWWRLLNVRHVVTPREIDFPGVIPVLDDPARGEHVYRLELGGAPLWIAHAADVLPDQEAALWYTSDMGKVEPGRTAVLEEAPSPEPRPATGPESARLVEFGPQRLTAQVKLSAPAVVVFSEVEYPGWRVYANGERRAALRAFGVLRAVALPAGEWEIEWRFRPLTVYVGLGLQLVAGLVLGGQMAMSSCRASKRRHP